MTNENGRRFVTWPHLWGVVVVVVAMGISTAGALWAQQGSLVSDKEQRQFEKRLDDHFAFIELQLSEIKAKLK